MPLRSRRTRDTNARPYRGRMLEARFDDLTGASPSFRLVEPVGVLEATRAGEVVATLEAAEAATGRGLWVAGFVTYEAAPGLDPALVVRPRDGRGSFRGPAPRLVRDVRARRGDHVAAPPRRRRGRRDPRGNVGADDYPRAVRVLRRPDPRADRGRRDLPGEPHDAPSLARRRRSAWVVPRPLLRPTWRVLRLPRPRPVSSALGLAGALLRAPRRRDRDQADEGHGTARPVARRRSRRRGASPRLGERSGGERDDRGPPPERPRPDQPDRLGDLGRRLPSRAIRDRLAADDDRVGKARSRRGVGGRVPRVVPERLGHRRAQGTNDGDHPRARGLAARDLLRRDRIRRTEGIGPSRCAIQRRDPHGHPRHRLAHRRVRRRRRHHVGLRGGRRVRGGGGEDPRPHGASSRLRAPGDDAVRPRRGRATPGHASPTPGRVRRLLRVPVRRDRGTRGRGEGGCLRAARTVPRPPRARQGRHGTGGVHAARERAATSSASRSTTYRRIPGTSSSSTRRRDASATRMRGAAIRMQTTSC